MIYEFGPPEHPGTTFRLTTRTTADDGSETGETAPVLYRGNVEVPLTKIRRETLLILVRGWRREGGLVYSPEQLKEAVGSGSASFAEDNIPEIRKAIKDGQRTGIITVRGHGYRFGWAVRRVASPEETVHTPPTSRDERLSQDGSVRRVASAAKPRDTASSKGREHGYISASVPSLVQWQERKPGLAGPSDLVLGAVGERMCKSLKRSIERRERWHGFLAGDIASGKSATVVQLARTFIDNVDDARVFVLPLGRDFALQRGEEWDRSAAATALTASLGDVDVADRGRILLVIEDTHESAMMETLPWSEPERTAATAARSLSDYNLLFTSRPGSYALEVRRALSECCGINPQLFATDAVDVARVMAERASDLDRDLTERFLIVFQQTGFSLVALAATIKSWTAARAGGAAMEVTVRLAYRAVVEELDRITSELVDVGGYEKERATLALIWMIGALDAPVRKSLLRRFFGLDLPVRFWKKLESLREVSPEERGAAPQSFNVLRHPAWGQLVMQAFDKDEQLRFSVVDAFAESSFSKEYAFQWADTEARKPSVCVLLAISMSGTLDSDQLSFYCSGRTMYDEYVQASSIGLTLRASQGADSAEIAQTRVAIASNVRRTNPRDPDQLLDNLSAALDELQLAVQEKVRLFGDDLVGDPKRGWAFYEVGNYHYLLGELDEAREYLRKSRNAELQAGESRLQQVAQSANREARVAIAQRAYEDAEDLVGEGLRILDQRASESDGASRSRFRSNALQLRAEIALCRRDFDESERLFTAFHEELRASSVVAHEDLGQARLAIAKGDGARALKIARAVYLEPTTQNTIEIWETCHRVLGDAYALEGRRDEAARWYREIIPKTQPPRTYESGLASERLQLLDSVGDAGLSSTDLRDVPL